MLVRIVAPVVVKPDKASKKPSVKLGTLLLSRNGMAPKSESTSQEMQTTYTPSRELVLSFLWLRVAMSRMKPVSRVMRAEKGILKAYSPCWR